MIMKKSAKKAQATEKQYSLIQSPVITEKSTMGSQHGQLTFRVPVDATKTLVKEAIEALFDVKVTKVNTLIRKGKRKGFRGRIGQRSDTKLAIVTLADGQTIDVATGI